MAERKAEIILKAEGNQGSRDAGGNFKKELRKIDIWSLSLGAIIGWGCFVMPGTNFLPKAGPSAILGLLIAGLVMAVISVSYGYCIRKYPLSGGEFVFSDAAFGKSHAFICGWMLVLGYWSLIPLNSTAIGLITRYLLPGIFQFGPLWEIAGWQVYLGEVLLSSAFIIVLGIMNIRGVKTSGWFQTLVAVLLTGSVLLALVGVLLTKPDLSNLKPFFAEIKDGQVVSKGVVACIISVACYAPYCFVGFDCIPQAAQEYKFSHKASTWLMIVSILIGAAIYAAIVFITAVVRPWGPMLLENPEWATGEMLLASIGRVGLVLIGIAMLCAVLSGINAFYLAASRLLYSMSYADALPGTFGGIHPHYGTPRRAILFLMLISLVCPWFGRQVLSWVVDMTCVGSAVGFTYTCASATVLSRREKKRGQAVVSGIGTVFSAFFIILSFVPASPGFLSVPSFVILGIWVTVGICLWFVQRKSFLHGRWNGMTVEQILSQQD